MRRLGSVRGRGVCYSAVAYALEISGESWPSGRRICNLGFRFWRQTVTGFRENTLPDDCRLWGMTRRNEKYRVPIY